MASDIRFSMAGSPLSTPAPGGTLAGIAQTARLGLHAQEVEFVRGVRMKDELAQQCGKTAAELGVSLSIHAPYYINLCSDEARILGNSHRHILESMRAAQGLKASPIVIHSGFYQGRAPEECHKRAIGEYQKILDQAEEAGHTHAKLGPELTGKKSAYGDLEQITALSAHFGPKTMVPVIDFAHYHARTRRIQGAGDYQKILDHCEKALGSVFGKSFHCHFSGIEFSDKGEKNHLPVSKDSPPLKPFLQVLKDSGYRGSVVCESPLMEKDVLLMQKMFDLA